MTATGICSVACCERDVFARGWCAAHYKRWKRDGNTHPDIPIENRARRPQQEPRPPRPVYVLCPEDLEDLVAQAVENDARAIFRQLWRLIGEWHLAGLIEETA